MMRVNLLVGIVLDIGKTKEGEILVEGAEGLPTGEHIVIRENVVQ